MKFLLRQVRRLLIISLLFFVAAPVLRDRGIPIPSGTEIASALTSVLSSDEAQQIATKAASGVKSHVSQRVMQPSSQATLSTSNLLPSATIHCYTWFQSGPQVRELQRTVEAEPLDGIYGPATRQAHEQYLADHNKEHHGCLPSPRTTQSPTEHTNPAISDDPPTEFLELEGLAVAEESYEGGDYIRGSYNYGVDFDSDQCFTRCEVLEMQKRKDGTWLSEYDLFESPDASLFHVDHLVALSEAHRSGASMWPQSKKKMFANDTKISPELIVVSATSNITKSDHDPANWKPTNQDHWCAYARNWITVKKTWNLSADAQEVLALTEMLSSCYP